MMASNVSGETSSRESGDAVNSPANSTPTAEVAAEGEYIEGTRNGVEGFPVHKNTPTDGRVREEKHPDEGGDNFITTSAEITPSQEHQHNDSTARAEAESGVDHPPVDGRTSAQGSPLADDADLSQSESPCATEEVSGAAINSEESDWSSRTETPEMAIPALIDGLRAENIEASRDSRSSNEVQLTREQAATRIQAARCRQSEVNHHEESQDGSRSGDDDRGRGEESQDGSRSGDDDRGRGEESQDGSRSGDDDRGRGEESQDGSRSGDDDRGRGEESQDGSRSGDDDRGRGEESQDESRSGDDDRGRGEESQDGSRSGDNDRGRGEESQDGSRSGDNDRGRGEESQDGSQSGDDDRGRREESQDGSRSGDDDRGRGGAAGQGKIGMKTGVLPAAGRQEVTIDKETIETIALVVEKQLEDEFLHQDAILSEIQAAINALSSDQAPEPADDEPAGNYEVSSKQPPSPEAPPKSINPTTLANDALEREKVPSKQVLPGHHSPNQPTRLSPSTPASPGSRPSLQPKTPANETLDPETEPNEQGSPCDQSPDWRPRVSPRTQVSSRSQQLLGDRTSTTKRSLSPSLRCKPIRALARGSMPALARTRATHKGSGYRDHPPRISRGAKSSAFGRVDSMDRGRGVWGRENAGALSVSRPKMHSVPRVADLEGADRLALAKRQTKAAEAAALVKQAHGRTAVYNPSWYNPEHADTSLPDSELFLEYVHGYAGETPGCGAGGMKRGRGGTNCRRPGKVGGARQASTRSTNVVWLHTGELVFPASGVVVIHDVGANRQRFFMGHDEEVTALAVHPFEDIVASGQAGRGAIVCLFDASLQTDARIADGDSQLATETVASEAGEAPLFLRELSLGEKEKRGVAALDFSSDGSLLVAMAGGEGQMLSVWDWLRGVRLATARAETSFLPANSVRFNPLLYFTGVSAETAGMSPGEVCYTLVSCGQRHIKFWTLTREWVYSKNIERRPTTRVATAVGGDEDEGRMHSDNVDGNGHGWEWNLASRRGTFGNMGELDTMVCMAFIGESWGGKEQRQRHEQESEDSSDNDIELLPIVRTVTGSENGGIYFWEVTELHPQHVGTDVDDWRMGWRPHGQLRAVVPNAHKGPLTDMCYLPNRGGDHQEAPVERVEDEGDPGLKEWGTLATCGGEGTLRLWVVGGKDSSPLQLLLTVDISNKGIGIGHARSVSWDLSGTTLAVGTVWGAVCLIQPGEETERPFAPSEARRKEGASVVFMLAVQGHPGSCKALASHPTRPWFVTGSSDRVLRLWDAHSKRQLSASRMLEKVSSAAFHPTGDMLAVGSEAGDLLLMALRGPPLTTEDSPRQSTDDTSSEGFTWDVLARKRAVLGGGAAANHAPTQPQLGFPKRRSLGKAEFHGGASTGHAFPANAGGDGDETSSSTMGARQANHRGRRPLPLKSKTSLRIEKLGKKQPKWLARVPPRPVGKGVSSFKQALEQGGTGGDMEVVAKGAFGSSSKNADVSVVKFSPSGKVLAASSGSFIYLYREVGSKSEGRFAVGGGGHGGRGAYRRYAVCTGHGRKIKSIDFSRDDMVVKSNDNGQELLFWEVSTGRQITDTFSLRDLEMDSWSSSMGWPMQGLSGVAAAASGRSSGQGSTGALVAVSRSNAGDVMAVVDEDNCVSLVRNPAPEKAKTRANWGHTAAGGICGLTFLCDDRHLVSTGGACIFVWRHVRRQPQRVRRLKDTDTAKRMTPQSDQHSPAEQQRP